MLVILLLNLSLLLCGRREEESVCPVVWFHCALKAVTSVCMGCKQLLGGHDEVMVRALLCICQLKVLNVYKL